MIGIVVGVVQVWSIPLYGQDEIALPQPNYDRGKPLMQALLLRHSARAFSARELPLQEVANIVWAANGVNRSDSGMRTAPSAKNWQEIDIYVARQDGLYRYDALRHVLILVVPEDLRSYAGRQRFTAEAPLDLIYVANYDRMDGADRATQDFYAATDTGFVSQNVYLYCASEGLSTVVLGYVDKPALAGKMGLTKNQNIILTQPIGYPAD